MAMIRPFDDRPHAAFAQVAHWIVLALALATLSACAAVFGAAAGLVKPASAHDWYPAWCCRGTDEGGDCAPIAASRVQETPAGYVIGGKFIKSYRETQWSPDGRYHACFPKWGGMSCFFAPAKGM